MAKRNSKVLIFIWAVFSAVVGLIAFAAVLDARAKPQPVSANDIPDHFRVVAFTAPGKPVLRKPDKDSGGSYTFYIDRRYRKSSEKILEERLPEAESGVKIRLFHEDPAARKQEVLLNIREGDTNYFSIYSVDGDKVDALRYSKLTGSDRSTAARTGAKTFAAAFLSGIVAVIILRAASGRKTGKGNAEPD